jgi:hypothetical protein
MAVVYRVPSAHCGDLLEAGNPAEVFARAEIHLTFFQAVSGVERGQDDHAGQDV